MMSYNGCNSLWDGGTLTTSFRLFASSHLRPSRVYVNHGGWSGVLKLMLSTDGRFMASRNKPWNPNMLAACIPTVASTSSLTKTRKYEDLHGQACHSSGSRKVGHGGRVIASVRQVLQWASTTGGGLIASMRHVLQWTSSPQTRRLGQHVTVAKILAPRSKQRVRGKKAHTAQKQNKNHGMVHVPVSQTGL